MIALVSQLLGLLPAEILVGEMTVLGRLEVDWFGEIQFLDDDAGSHVEILLDDLHELVR